MSSLRSDCYGCRRVEPERAARLIRAVLETMANWQERLAEIELHATPSNKTRALSLMRDMEFSRQSLERLANSKPRAEREDL